MKTDAQNVIGCASVVIAVLFFLYEKIYMLYL